MNENELTSAALAAADETAAGPPFVAALPASRVLTLAGPDARAFLHGQLANDVNGLAIDEAGSSLLLNHKGHAMAQAAVLRTDEGLYCVVDDDKLDWVRDTLERHIVFDDVRLSVPAAAVLTVQGVAAERALAAAGIAAPQGSAVAVATQATAATDATDTADATDAAGVSEVPAVTVFVYRSRRSRAGGYDLVATAADDSDAELAVGELRAALLAAGVVEVGPEQLAAARIAAVLPTAGGEGGEGILPQESGLDSLISYQKGCYLGQEIMARIEARGNLRRALATIELDEMPVAPADRDITAEGRLVGRLGTVARFPDGRLRALCVLRSDLGADVALTVGSVAARRVGPVAPIMPA